MIRVIVADDEKIIREGIGRFVQETEGFELIETCENGEEACEKIQKWNPDIVICDIMMPVCDGIETVRRCREQGIESEFILLSGYQEFEYAREGIRLGVLDYVNKPVNRDTFRSVLEKAKQVIENKKNVNRQLQSYLYEKVIDNEEVDLIKRAEITEQEKREYRILAANIAASSLAAERQQYLKEAVSFCEKILKEEIREEYIVYEKRGILVIIFMDLDSKQKILEKTCEELIRYGRKKGKKVFLGVGNRVKDMKEIPLSYEQAKAAMYEAQNSGKICCFFEHLPYTYTDPKLTYALDLIDVFNLIHLREVAEVQKKVKSLVEKYKTFAPPYMIYSFVVSAAQEFTDSILKEEPAYDQGWRTEQIVELTVSENISVLMKNFDHLLKSASDIIEDKKHYGGNFDEIMRYISIHYMEDISIEKICNVFYFNKSYFSNLFKIKTGENYNDYITDLRMQKAKELLKLGKYKTNEIAEMVGYSSSRYFSRVFKMKTGELPKDYRSKYLINKEEM